MKDRSFEQVLAALLALKCRVAHESEHFVVVVRGAVVVQYLPRAPLIPVDIQRRIIRAFSFTEAEFLDALIETN